MLDQHVQLDFYSETTVRGETCRPTQTHYPDSEPTSLCTFFLMMRAQWRSNKYQFYSLQCYQIRASVTVNSFHQCILSFWIKHTRLEIPRQKYTSVFLLMEYTHQCKVEIHLGICIPGYSTHRKESTLTLEPYCTQGEHANH